MRDIQSVFYRLNDNRKKYKELQDFFKERFMENLQYKGLHENTLELNAKKKAIKEQIYEMNHSEHTKMQDLKIDMDSDKEVLSDIVLSTVSKGEKVEIVSEYKQTLLPIFSVSFKKVE